MHDGDLVLEPRNGRPTVRIVGDPAALQAALHASIKRTTEAAGEFAKAGEALRRKAARWAGEFAAADQIIGCPFEDASEAYGDRYGDITVGDVLKAGEMGLTGGHAMEAALQIQRQRAAKRPWRLGDRGRLSRAQSRSCPSRRARSSLPSRSGAPRLARSTTRTSTSCARGDPDPGPDPDLARVADRLARFSAGLSGVRLHAPALLPRPVGRDGREEVLLHA